MAGLNELIQRLERMGAVEIKARIASKVRDTVHAECVRGFSEQRDPYGNAWEPRKKSKDGHRLLDKSGHLLGTLTAKVVGGDLVRLSTDASYARFLESGTRTMVARKIFPEPSRSLGTWSDPVHRAAVEAVQELMR